MSKLEGIQEYRLIVVENTPKNERARIKHARISDIAYTSSSYAFDGVSHGNALDLGLGLVDSEFVFIFDTDFFILKRDFFPVFIEKMQKERYDAIGPEFFDGRDWKKVLLPEVPFDYVINSTKFKHRLVGDTGRKTLYVRGSLDDNLHKQLIDKNLKEYYNYALFENTTN